MRTTEITISAQLAKVALKVKQKDDVVRRICTMTLEREFDAIIAAALGEDAKTARDSLLAHGISKVEIPIDALAARAKLVSLASSVELPVLRGVKAVGKVKTSDEGDEEPPTIALTYEFDFHEEAWVFLGRKCASWIDAHLTPLQTELNLSPAPPKPDDDDEYQPAPGEAF